MIVIEIIIILFVAKYKKIFDAAYPVLPPAPRCLSNLGQVFILKFLYQSIFDSLVLPVTVGSGRNQFYNLEFLEMLLK